MVAWIRFYPILVAVGFLLFGTSVLPIMAEEAVEQAAEEFAFDEDVDIENLVSVLGEVKSVDKESGTVAIKDAIDEKADSKTLLIDPQTTTIWGEYDEIQLADLPVGSKIAGEYILNPDGSMVATYLEIVLDEEAFLPPVEEFTEDTVQ